MKYQYRFSWDPAKAATNRKKHGVSFEQMTAMRREYDFSKGERGKFFRKDAELQLPVYLEEDVLEYLQDRAREKGVELNELVNALLKQDIALIESAK
ncbi:BrnT family toxin [Lentisalinibacter sediminis]|uniref:hypothetical protein n=1 Tax=Lentisalinibacter sediminis TaxID=2992237 RepID=UPI00386C0C24